MLANSIMGVLVIIVLGFLISTISSFSSNENTISFKKTNLSSLLRSTPYEKETGYKIKVEIQNGCGVPGAAHLFTDFLREEGFDVVSSTNASNFMYQKTKILHHSNDISRANELASAIGISENLIEIEQNDFLFHDLTLIIGRNYTTLPSHGKAEKLNNPL